jgi:hypothetical protein
VSIKHHIITALGFLRWSRLDDEGLKEVRSHVGNELKGVYLSPDVHSLHIVWQFSDGVICHEIADYPYDDSYEADALVEWFINEVGDDYMEEIEGQSIEEVLSDYNDIADVADLPAVSLSLFEEAQAKALP